MTSETAQTLLSAAALTLLGLLGGCLVFHAVPEASREPLTFVLGALSGAVTTGGGLAVAHKPGATQPPQD
jgi:hypothetical protein